MSEYVLVAPLYSAKLMRAQAEKGSRPMRCQREGCQRRVIVEPISLMEIQRLEGEVWCIDCALEHPDADQPMGSTPALDMAYAADGNDPGVLRGSTARELLLSARRGLARWEGDE